MKSNAMVIEELEGRPNVTGLYRARGDARPTARYDAATYNRAAGAILWVVFVLTLVVMATGCQTPPPAGHVVDINVPVTDVGLGYDPVSKLPVLQLRRGQLMVKTYPVMPYTNKDGTMGYAIPETCQSYEVAAHEANAFHSAVGLTITFATGEKSVQTLLGGGHVPINANSIATNPNQATNSPPVNAPTGK
jgi:hypothetical protein